MEEQLFLGSQPHNSSWWKELIKITYPPKPYCSEKPTQQMDIWQGGLKQVKFGCLWHVPSPFVKEKVYIGRWKVQNGIICDLFGRKNVEMFWSFFNKVRDDHFFFPASFSK